MDREHIKTTKATDPGGATDGAKGCPDVDPVSESQVGADGVDSSRGVRLGRDVFIAPGSYVGGDVVLGDCCTVMYQVVIRGDIGAIRLGARVNIQDGTIVHTPKGVPLDIGDDVGVGHRAVVHGRRVGSRSLIATGAILLDHCEIGSRCLIGAGAVVPPGTIIPDGKVVLGVPARIVRDTTERDLTIIDHVVESYVELGRRHARGQFPAFGTVCGEGAYPGG
jgi:carbonic anhydrase/acetyltransferase-like protein (isoleucine patch superfamily)